MSENINNDNIVGGDPQSVTPQKKSMAGKPFWVDAMVVVLLFIIAQAVATVACMAMGLRMPGVAMTTSFDAEVQGSRACKQTLCGYEQSSFY